METAFLKTCESGDITEAREHPELSSSKERRTLEGRTCLHEAVVAGDLDFFRPLKRPELIKEMDKNGDTALHLAVRIYSVDMVTELLKYDLCDCKNIEQETPLNMAIRLQFLEAVKCLIPCTKTPLEENKFFLHRVVSLNQVKVIDILIHFHKKKKIDLSGVINLRYQPSTNPPQTENYDTSSLDNERNYAANPQHIQSIVGDTSLQTTVRNIYEHLIKQEKSLTQPIVQGETPLHIAARNKYEPMVDLLLKIDGVNKHALNDEGKTPVDLAREVLEYHESFRIIRKLGNFSRKVKPFMYCAPQVCYEKHKRAGDMINRAYQERRNAELVVAALLATMTFTAAFTVPGGFQTDTKLRDELGSPVLISFTSFRLFLTVDCIAFFLSLFACVMWEMTSEFTVGDKLLFMTINSAVVCGSFGFTAYGFLAALYAVLGHKVNAFSWLVLGILICITMCGIFAFIYQSARFAVSRARFLRLCGAPRLVDDIVEKVWKIFEGCGILDILRSFGDKIRDTIYGRFKVCSFSFPCRTDSNNVQPCV